MKLITPASAVRVCVVLIAFLYALGKSYEVDAQPAAYPVVTYSHLSDVTRSAAQEVTADYLGAGLGVEFRKVGVVVEATLGAKSLGCTARDCGRSAAAQVSVTWRGRRHD